MTNENDPLWMYRKHAGEPPALPEGKALNVAIDALERGDGATVLLYHARIAGWLKHYREIRDDG